MKVHTRAVSSLRIRRTYFIYLSSFRLYEHRIIFREYRKHYLGNQFLPEQMGHLEVGPKETTGPVRNENGYVQSFDDPRRFITTYQMKYAHCISRPLCFLFIAKLH